MIDRQASSYQSQDYKNKLRFLDALRDFYDDCHIDFKAAKMGWATDCIAGLNDGNSNCVGNGLYTFVGDSCTTNEECHTGSCDIDGIYHGCAGKCVQKQSEIFPSIKGILLNREPRIESNISPEWRDYNCPDHQDIWYEVMWLKIRGEIGHIEYDGFSYKFYREEQNGRLNTDPDALASCGQDCTQEGVSCGVCSTTNYKTMNGNSNSFKYALAHCMADEACYGVGNNADSFGKYHYWTPEESPLYFRFDPNGKEIWIKNPFTSSIKLFEAKSFTEQCKELSKVEPTISSPNKGDTVTKIAIDGEPIDDCIVSGDILDSNNMQMTLARGLKGIVNGICDYPNQQRDETPWVYRPMIENVVQKFDEPHEEFQIAGYPFVNDWGFDPDTGITTVRDIDNPEIKSLRNCEVLPDFTLRCATCDCFQDATQGFFAGPMCEACSVGYATKNCKKICPGFDGKNIHTICSGNGVCNFGKKGTGRCMCGGMGGSANDGGSIDIYKDQDGRPKSAMQSWCTLWKDDLDGCDRQANCYSSGQSCNSIQDSDMEDFSSLNDKYAVPMTYPRPIDYTYYFVKYRDFSTWIWPHKKSVYSRYSVGQDISMKGLSNRGPETARDKGYGPVPGYASWHPDTAVISHRYYDEQTDGYHFIDPVITGGNERTMVDANRVEHQNLYEAKQYCNSVYECPGIEITTFNDVRKFWSIPNGAIMSQNVNDNYKTYVKNRKGEEGCLDFQRCGQDGGTSGTQYHIEIDDRLNYVCPGNTVNSNPLLKDYPIGEPIMDRNYPTNGGESSILWADKNLARWFGVDFFSGCCRCGGGYRGHGIPEPAVRWLHSPDTNNQCKNTFSISPTTTEENILREETSVEHKNNPTLLDGGYTAASNNICEWACHNGYPMIPDIHDLVYQLDNPQFFIDKVYSGCCSCAAYADGRPTDGSFWHFRMNSEKVASNIVENRRITPMPGHLICSVANGQCANTVSNTASPSFWYTWGGTDPMSPWWSPRAYSSDNLAAKVNLPNKFANFASRYDQFKEDSFRLCPGGDETQCENDCKLCKNSHTGFNCAGVCHQCLMGGNCIAEPTPDGSTLCNCPSDSLDSRSGCCPVGFSLLLGSDVLERPQTVAGIKAGITTFFERNRGTYSNAASAYFVDPTIPYTEDDAVRDWDPSFDQYMDYAFAEDSSAAPATVDLNAAEPYYVTGYKNLKLTQIQAGCYPCPNMMTIWGLCDRELGEGEKCSEEETELTQEKMWEFSTELTNEIASQYNIWLLRPMPFQFSPQKFPFPYGFQKELDYGEYGSIYGYSVIGVRITGLYGTGLNVKAPGIYPNTNPLGYEMVEDAKKECDKYPDCKYIVNIVPGKGQPPLPSGEERLWLDGDAIGSALRPDDEGIFNQMSERQIGVYQFQGKARIADLSVVKELVL